MRAINVQISRLYQADAMSIVKKKERESYATRARDRKKDPSACDTVLHVNPINYMYNFINIVRNIIIIMTTETLYLPPV